MDLEILYERINKMKTKTLMEEPCPLYEPEWEDVINSQKDWEDFWYNEDKQYQLGKLTCLLIGIRNNLLTGIS